ncbi:MAG TPA: endonuclease [Tepidisphaeraceae bacterium]|nr:endonuclease [Tepidisphaeraceae bacterium]
MNSRRLVLQAAAAAVVAALGSRSALAQYQAPNPVYNPGNYYSTATGTGSILKANLNALIDGHTLRDYETNSVNGAVPALEYLDQDPNNTANVLLVYSGVSVSKDQFPSGSANREHCWPKSYGFPTNNPAYSDLFNLRPCDSNVNSDRNNDYYDNGGTPGHVEAPLCNQVPGISWEPRPVEKGDLARSMFYMDTRYSGDSSDGNTSDLELVGAARLGEIQTGNPYMGNLDTLLKWHYQDGVNNVERRRNHLIHTNDTGVNGWNGTAYNQGNRNPFIDHPEWVWSVFGGGNNNSQIKITGGTSSADGASVSTKTLRVMKNGAWGITTVSLAKTGAHPTTYDVTASGSATTADAGAGQPFDYNAQSRTVTIGMTGSTATTGARTGAITIDNTDITTGGTGLGSGDGNDVISVVGHVVDNRVVTASAASFGRVVVGSTVSAGTTLSSPGADDSNTRVTVTAAASAADAHGVAIAAAGSGALFDGTTTAAGRSLQANFATAGVKGGSRAFTVQGEGLAGEVVNGVSVSYSATALDHAQPSFTADAAASEKTIDFGYVPANFAARSASVDIFNRAAGADPALTAGLDVDSVSASSDARVGTSIAPTATTIAAGTSRGYVVTFTPGAIAAGATPVTQTIGVSDENIPGGVARPSLTVVTTGATITEGSFSTTGFINLLPGETFNTGPASIGAGATLTKTGPGALNFTGSQSHGPSSSLVVSQGAVTLDSDAGAPSTANLAIAVNAGGSAMFNHTQHLRGLSVAGGQAVVSTGANKVIDTASLAVTAGGALDLGDNKMIVRNGDAGTWSNSAYTGISRLVANGRAGGSGIITTMPDAAGPAARAAVGVALASSALGIAPAATATWAGEVISGSDVLLMYTWGGDADLNGRVDGDDYFRIDSHAGQVGAGWVNGDFNYSGSINGDDYFIIDSNVGRARAALTEVAVSAGGMTAVPEPASAALLAVGALGLLQRRRRR